MSTYRTERGQLIKSVSSDPSNPKLGEIWYNTTIGSLKGYIFIADAWSAGGNLNTGRDASGGAGTQEVLRKNTMALVGQNKMI